MPEVELEERNYRIVGLHHGRRRVWRYSSRPDALWRARQLEKQDELIEFSYADVEWKPAPSGWLTSDEI